MSWQLLALVCSLSYAVQNLLVKWLTIRGIRSRTVLWFMFAAGVPFLGVLYFWTRPHPIQPLFYLYIGIGLTLNFVAFYGYVRAIHEADVSLVMPLISLTPLFMLLTSWVLLGEFPDLQGLGGILAVVLGTYVLAKEPGMRGLEPLKALWSHVGTRWALAVAVIWSITSNFDKLAVLASTPYGYTFWFHGAFTVLFLPLFLTGRSSAAWANHDGSEAGTTTNRIYGVLGLGLVAVGLLQAVMASSQMAALVYTDVTYVIAVKRGGMLVSVLGGGLLYGEKHTSRRFGASIVVFAGLLGIMFR